MNPTDSSPASPWMRVLRFPLTRMAVLYLVLAYLYLSGFFFRASYAKGPWEGVAATLMAGGLMLCIYASFVYFIEGRPARELALRPMGRELGLGLLLGAGLYTLCVLIMMGLGHYRIVGMHDWHILIPGVAVAVATGVFEELVFRGGVFRLLEEWLGSWAALVLSSLALIKELDPAREAALVAHSILLDVDLDLQAKIAAQFPGLKADRSASAVDGHVIGYRPRRDFQALKHWARAVLAGWTGQPPKA